MGMGSERGRDGYRVRRGFVLPCRGTVEKEVRLYSLGRNRSETRWSHGLSLLSGFAVRYHIMPAVGCSLCTAGAFKMSPKHVASS